MPAPYTRRVAVTTNSHAKEHLIVGSAKGAAVLAALEALKLELEADIGFASVSGLGRIEIQVDGDDLDTALGVDHLWTFNGEEFNGIGGATAQDYVAIVNTGTNYLRWTNINTSTKVLFADIGGGTPERTIFQMTAGAENFSANTDGTVVKNLEIDLNAETKNNYFFPGVIVSNVLLYSSVVMANGINGPCRSGVYDHVTIGKNVVADYRGFGSNATVTNCYAASTGGIQSLDFEGTSGSAVGSGNVSSDTTAETPSIALEGAGGAYTIDGNFVHTVQAAGPLDDNGNDGADTGYLGRVAYGAATGAPVNITDVNGATNEVTNVATAVDVNFDVNNTAVLATLSDGARSQAQTVNTAIDADTASINIVQDDLRFGGVVLTVDNLPPINIKLSAAVTHDYINLQGPLLPGTTAKTAFSDLVELKHGDQIHYKLVTETNGDTVSWDQVNQASVSAAGGATLPDTVLARYHNGTNWYPAPAGDGSANFEAIWLYQPDDLILSAVLTNNTGSYDYDVTVTVGDGVIEWMEADNPGIPSNTQWDSDRDSTGAVAVVGSVSATASTLKLRDDITTTNTKYLFARQRLADGTLGPVTPAQIYSDTLALLIDAAVYKGQGSFSLTQSIPGVVSLVAYATNRTIAEATLQSNVVLAGDGLSGTFDYERGAAPNMHPSGEDVNFILTVPQ